MILELENVIFNIDQFPLMIVNSVKYIFLEWCDRQLKSCIDIWITFNLRRKEIIRVANGKIGHNTETIWKERDSDHCKNDYYLYRKILLIVADRIRIPEIAIFQQQYKNHQNVSLRQHPEKINEK